MRFALLSVMLLLLPAVASAQQAKVLSGEHQGFTRLVAPLPIGANWDISHIDRTVKVTLPVPERGLDIGDVFTLIPRDRVADIALQEDGFTLTLGCDCLIAPFVAQGRFLVLDVTSPGVSRPVPFVPRSRPAADLPETNPALVGVPDDARAQPEAAGPVPLIIGKDAAPLVPKALPPLARKPLSRLEEDALEEVQQRLARELGTATTRGMLTLLPGVSLPNTKRAQVDPNLLPTPETPPEPDVVEGLVNNMRITSSLDLPDLEQRAEDAQSLSGIQCPPDDTINPAAWVDDSGFTQLAGKARQSLYGEFDRLNTQAALELAKIYLHYGFGAEAEQVLSLDPDLSSGNPLLIDIARIMERGEAGANSVLPQLLDCPSDVALWAILARPTLEVARKIDPNPALLALNKLPVHLRQFLAPALSRRFLSHGDTEAAATALRNLQRLPSPLVPSAKLAEANIAIEEGDVEQGAATLADVIDDNTEQSPEALIALVDARLAANQPIDLETAGLVEAYAKELNGTDMGAGLRRAHVLALVKSSQFDRAFAASTALGGDSEEPAAVDLRLRLMEELTAAADDIVFLDHVFAQPNRDIARLPVRHKLALATRLVDLGFGLQAEDVIASIPSRPRIDARQILAARIALDLGQPMRAQSELTELEGEEADRLRAVAKDMAGAHDEAYAIYRRLENDPAAVQSAWLAQDIDSLALANDTVFGPVLALTEGITPPSTETDGMLARSSVALEESAAARDALLTMLRAPQTEIGQDVADQ